MRARTAATTPDQIAKLIFCQMQTSTVAELFADLTEIFLANSSTMLTTRCDGAPCVSKAMGTKSKPRPGTDKVSVATGNAIFCLRIYEGYILYLVRLYSSRVLNVCHGRHASEDSSYATLDPIAKLTFCPNNIVILKRWFSGGRILPTYSEVLVSARACETVG